MVVSRGSASSVMPPPVVEKALAGTVTWYTPRAAPRWEAAAEMATVMNRRLVLVLGEMRELGSEAARGHAEVGRVAYLRHLGVTYQRDFITRGVDFTIGEAHVKYRAPLRFDQTHHRPSDRGLSASGLADQRQHLAAVDVERDPVDREYRLHGPLARLVGHMQVPHAKHRLNIERPDRVAHLVASSPTR